jgi:hypothetical protein
MVLMMTSRLDACRRIAGSISGVCIMTFSITST